MLILVLRLRYIKKIKNNNMIRKFIFTPNSSFSNSKSISPSSCTALICAGLGTGGLHDFLQVLPPDLPPGLLSDLLVPPLGLYQDPPLILLDHIQPQGV